jgi:hypothetical protein
MSDIWPAERNQKRRQTTQEAGISGLQQRALLQPCAPAGGRRFWREITRLHPKRQQGQCQVRIAVEAGWSCRWGRPIVDDAPLHSPVRGSLERGKWGQRKRVRRARPTEAPKQPQRPPTHQIKQFYKHFNTSYVNGTPKFRKFGFRCTLCEITGVFPHGHLAFALHTGFFVSSRRAAGVWIKSSPELWLSNACLVVCIAAVKL